MTFIGLAAYLLPIPALIWAWVIWFKAKPRFVLPKGRSALAFSDLILVSANALSVLLVMFYASNLPETTKYSFAVASSRFGVLASTLSLGLACVGKGRVCFPVAVASFGLGLLWVVSLATY